MISPFVPHGYADPGVLSDVRLLRAVSTISLVVKDGTIRIDRLNRR